MAAHDKTRKFHGIMENENYAQDVCSFEMFSLFIGNLPYFGRHFCFILAAVA